MSKDTGKRKLRQQTMPSISNSLSRPRSKVYKVNSTFSSCYNNWDSSTRMPNPKSHNLISLINQFENLDTDTTSIAGFSPKQLREISRKKQMNKKTNQCVLNLEVSDIVENTHEKGRDMSSRNENPMSYLLPLKTKPKVYLSSGREKSQSPSSKSILIDHETVMNSGQENRRRPKFTSAALTQNIINGNKRAVSMQEKIKFFNGSDPPIENNKSKIYEIAPVKSISENVQKSSLRVDKFDSLTKKKYASSQTLSVNLSKTNFDKAPNKRNSLFNLKATNQFLTQKKSPKNLNCEAFTKPVIDPDCRRANLKYVDPKKNKNSPSDLTDFSDRLKIKDLGQDVEDQQKIKHDSQNKFLYMKGLSRKPSDKVEALFHKGMDQKKRDKSQNYESCIFPKIKNEYNNTESQKILLAMQKELNYKNEAKFLNTRKKFETNFSPEESTQHDNCMSVEQDKNNIQPFKHNNKLSRGLINEQRSYSFESPQQQCRYARAESVPHEVAENHAIDKGGARLVEGGTQIFQLTQENLQHKNRTKSGAFREHNAIDTIPTNSQDTTLLTPAKTIPIPSCGLVEEKVKHFEKIRSTGKTGTIPTKRSITRRLNRSLRGFFDYWDSNEKIRVKNENSSKDELNGSRKEFQSVGSQKIKARDILNNDVVSSKNLSKMKNKFLGNSGKSSESSSLDEMDVWIIKKVDCGLKQPKPLRAVEIKSMVLLCSSYGGGNKISSISN